jgi:hypothetical protein
MQTKLLRIVIASPGDVKLEWDAVEVAVQDVNSSFRNLDMPYRLDVSRWDRDALPGINPPGPQGLPRAVRQILGWPIRADDGRGRMFRKSHQIFFDLLPS